MYIQFSIFALQNQAEHLSNFLFERGAVSVTFESSDDEEAFQNFPNEIKLWQHVTVKAIFTDENQSLEIEKILENILQLKFKKEILAEENWSEKWKQHFQPQDFGNHLWVCPTDMEVSDPNANIIWLDPGLAFGTGTHPTTNMCLTWLAKNLKPNLTVIDYGCGSGILAIAAAKLGAKKIYAIDHDPQAIQATTDNFIKNQIPKNNYEILLPEENISEKADVLVANILLNPLIELLPVFQKLMKPTAQIVIAGVLDHQFETLKTAYKPFINLKISAKNAEWLLITS